MSDIEKLREAAKKVLDTKLIHIFPVLAQIEKAEAEGRELKPEEYGRIWNYDPLLRARIQYAEVQEHYVHLAGEPEVDALEKQCTDHMAMLNKKWNEVGVFKSA